jgi:hypothetical protein
MAFVLGAVLCRVRVDHHPADRVLHPVIALDLRSARMIMAVMRRMLLVGATEGATVGARKLLMRSATPVLCRLCHRMLRDGCVIIVRPFCTFQSL